MMRKCILFAILVTALLPAVPVSADCCVLLSTQYGYSTDGQMTWDCTDIPNYPNCHVYLSDCTVDKTTGTSWCGTTCTSPASSNACGSPVVYTSCYVWSDGLLSSSGECPGLDTINLAIDCTLTSSSSASCGNLITVLWCPHPSSCCP